MAALGELYAAGPLWAWMGLAAALLAIEVVSGSGWLLWASASAAATGVAVALLRLPAALALVVFAVLAIVSTLLARRYLPRSLRSHGRDINDTAARLVGAQGRAVGNFDGRSGRVSVDGKEWAADLDGEGPVEAGAEVKVTAVEGARLRIRRA